MSSTYNDVRAAIESRIATEMALAPSYPVAYPNVPFTPPNNLPYVEPVLTGKNLPPSWNGKWRSKGGQIEKGYIPYMVAKDMQTFIQNNAGRIGRES